ncbi:MAG: HD-GYP domain-containing protein, partial [bacterium]
MKRDLLLNQLVDACATLTAYIEHQSAVHAYAIADLAVQFAQWYKLSVGQVRDIYYAGMLHDLGEVVLHGDLLSKGGELSAEETEMMRKHPVVAYRFLSRIPGFERVSCLVRWHHENYDGTGYPDRLSYQAVPLEVQILRIVDTFVSLQSDRPHRPAHSLKEAKELLWSERGRMCSYKVIKNFLSALEKKEIVYRKADFSFPEFFEASPEISSKEGDAILVTFAIGLSDFISHRIPYLHGYGWRVAGVADAFARWRNLNDSQRFLLFLASFLFE